MKVKRVSGHSDFLVAPIRLLVDTIRMSADSLIVSADAIRKTTDKKGLLMAQKEQKKWENLDFLGF